MGHQGGVVLASSAERSCSRSAGSETSPAPSAYHRRWRTRAAQLLDPASPRGCADAGLLALQHTQLGEVAGPPARRSAADGRDPARPGCARVRTTRRPGRDRRARRRARAPALARSRPCPTRVLCRSRLPNEDCQACRSARPARTWSRACRPSPRARASSARTSRHSSRVVTGEDTSTRTRAQPGAGVVELAAGHADPGALELEDGRVVARARWPGAAADTLSTRASSDRVRPPAAISATSAAASAPSSRAGLA